MLLLGLAGCGPAAPAERPSPTVTAAPTTTLTATVEPSATATVEPSATATVEPSATATPSPEPPTPSPQSLTADPRYSAYIAAASKDGQAYHYSCEFDAAWVVLQTFGVDVGVDAIIARTPIDSSVEPRYVETDQGWLIYGGDIRRAFSGDYRESFLARSSGAAIAPVFASFGLAVAPVHDRAGVEAALRRGALIWMKTTVDFKAWRPATWVTPDGARVRTVLGNDHAVVAIGFNDEVVVIRDVLGPTSSNWQRPLEYEVPWATFLWAWAAQDFDGLAVGLAGGG